MLDWLVPAAAVALAVALHLVLRARQRRRTARLRAANAELSLRVEELAAAAASRTRFLAMMSHEIRTPLTGIVGFAEVLTDEPLSEAGRRSLDGIQRSAQALQGLLGDILDFSRIDAGALPMQRLPVDLEALLSEVRDEFAPQARQRGLGFGLSVAAEARRWTETDPLRLRQVVVNLVSNAIRYTEAGAVRVTAAADPSDPETVVIRVVDTGVGIAPEDQERIFDAFTQASDGGSARGEGVGLGLAIANGLVRAMGGALSLASTTGRGSTFTVRLPLPACAAAPARAVAGRTSAGAAPCRVLLVDDVAMNRELFASMLAREGHEVTVAEDGEAALRRLEAGSFDVALIDIQMPFMDGLELTRRIRAAGPDLASLPIIALSAAAYGEDRERAEAAGMNGYVTKPATRDDIVDAIARARAAPADMPGPGKQASPEPPGPVVDRRMLDEQRVTFGDERLARFLELLRQELARRREALRAAAEDGDRTSLAHHAHAAASAAGNLGFQSVLLLGRRIETEAAGMTDIEMAAAVGEISASIDQAQREIDSLRAAIGATGADQRTTG